MLSSMPTMSVPIPRHEFEALRRLAETEWRTPKEQASALIAEGLRRAGALDPDDPQRGSQPR